jgi:molybdopterin synthase sulfur carrier subunit
VYVLITYFGQIVEVTGKRKETLNVENETVEGCLQKLYALYPDLKDISFKIAQDHVFVNSSTKLSGKELALLPPFAGG